MQVGVLGLGNLGTAVANLIAANGFDVLGWEYNESVCSEINTRHVNTRFLPNVALDRGLRASAELQHLSVFADVLFITLPSIFVRATLEALFSSGKPKATTVVVMSKGGDSKTGQLTSDIVAEFFPVETIAVAAGPSLANEFASYVPTVINVASANPVNSRLACCVLNSEFFVVSIVEDMRTLELSAIIKNIYALGLGIVEHADEVGLNFTGAYLTLALREMRALMGVIDGRADQLWEVSGVGDLVATCMSPDSHNRTMGRLVGAGKTIDQIIVEMGTLPEGYNSINLALALAKPYQLEMPLAELIRDTLEMKISAEQFFPSFIEIFRD
jgi:glycerol-3-phosphate dehydrogenase (NAD(P)+)